MRKLIIVLIFVTNIAHAQLTSQQEVTPDLVEKREELKKQITDNYIGLKSSFVVSDNVSILKNASALENSLNKFKFKKLNLTQMNEATKTRKEIIELSKEIQSESNINRQREIFQKLSSKFWSIADKFKANDVMLYLQVCPMTNAVWVSNTKEIKNPYYPKNMLTCGEVKASI
ncbi:DUF3347 domain-containing protein [Aestuariibaculum marinum]|uniref:DUF3347 domain-containing protein n=1 Tax=Aestuariibaculum marinum TaxID=2683592 RepID=A0A8J6Q044_9FLAO|nr:DUF3347 domain-containing protein [Aestuariibaculum marinum]MBD0825442.1 DUF3347 domain-containing protein [Aestuariibaculum marinum]